MATQWAAQGKDPRDTRVKVGARFTRIAFQIVAGRQVFRHPCIQGRHYILDKLSAFHREHDTGMVEVLRDLQAVEALGTVRSAASLRKRLMTMTPAWRAALRNGRLAYAPVRHYPDPFVEKTQPICGPRHQLRRLFQLGLERDATSWRQLLDVLGPNVEQGAQGEPNHAPVRVPDDPGDGDPDMTIEKLLVGRTRRGIMMDARAFNLWTCTFGRSVVQCEEQHIVSRYYLGDQTHEQTGDPLRLASHSADELIELLVVPAQATRPQPTGDGAASLSEQHAGDERQQAPRQLGMQDLAKLLDPCRDLRRQVPGRHPWLSCATAPFW
jgi:hypothetical protein